MADTLSISVDLSELMQMGALVRQSAFVNLGGAVQRIAEAGVSRWQTAVHAAPLWEGERQAYMDTIRARQIDELTWEIVSDYKFVEDIESGRPPRDLKVMLNTSLKVRVSKAGRRYLIIPFRHNTPGNTALGRAMPKEVYQSARELAPSRIVGQGRRLSGTGAWDVNTKKPATVRARKYVWGGRLAAEPEYKLRKDHKTDPFNGMVRFDTKTPGGKRYSTYMTFRVMAEGSRGWIVPAKPGLFIAKAVAESLQRTAQVEFGAAMQRDLDAA
jgi:hypothetical protein